MANPKHSNPGSHRSDRKATAPYNFVPLPEKVVTIDPNKIPGHDTYTVNTGYLDCTLTTETPTYTRWATNLEFFQNWSDKMDKVNANQGTREEYAQFSLDDMERPLIPGSSLRGMTRALVEIAGYGKMQWVTDQSLTYRNIADTFYRDELLKSDGYKFVTRGRKKKNVPHSTLLMQSGYIEKKNEKWFIRPAKSIGGVTFARVLKENFEPILSDLEKWDKNYGKAHRIWAKLGQYDYQNVRGDSVQIKFMPVSDVSPDKKDGFQECVLTISGPMDGKKYEAVIFPPIEDDNFLISIDSTLIEAYQEQITNEQKDIVGKNGVLSPRQPVFYLIKNEELIFFGHTMMLRLLYPHTPYDLIPEALRPPQGSKDGNPQIDLAEAIFGYTPNKADKQGRAGRVYFSDARFVEAEGDIWLPEGIITPKILSGPKPTTFQHYLVQDKNRGHDPDNKKDLAHYGTPTPDETVIRGHKLYWHQGPVSGSDIQEAPQDDPDRNQKGWAGDTQHTQIKPVNKGVTFRFKVHFENLRDYELGALLWALDLPENCRHKIGMGKPLGLGSVKISPRLVLSNRQQRYQQLFKGEGWLTAEEQHNDLVSFKQAFEKFILTEIAKPENESKEILAEVDRIGELLTMLNWEKIPVRKQVEYMQLGGFKERPVLPTPSGVVDPDARVASSSKPNYPDPPPAKPASPLPKRPAYRVNQEIEAKITGKWDKGRIEVELPGGDKGFLKASKKQLAKVAGNKVALVVIEIKNDICYLELP